VKITIECEKCGRRVLVAEHQYVGSHVELDDEMLTCTACRPPEPHWGPFTVEMIAKMLADSPPWSGWEDGNWEGIEFSGDDFRCMARAVIDLLARLHSNHVIEVSRLSTAHADDLEAVLRDISKLASKK